MFEQIFIPQHLVDEIEEWTDGILKNKEGGVVAKSEEGYSFHEISLADKKEQELFFEQIKSFVKEHCKVSPIKAALNYRQEEIDEITEFIGSSSFASIMVSIEKNIPLYCDDLGLRRAGVHLQPSLVTVGIQPILLKMKDRGLISLTHYSEALCQLILGGYFYISVNAYNLWWICEKYGRNASPQIDYILKRQLQGPYANYLSALIVAAHFIRKVWLEVPEKEDKLQLIDLAIEAVITGRDLLATKAHLKNILTLVFGHYKRPLPLLSERVDSWGFKDKFTATSPL